MPLRFIAVVVALCAAAGLCSCSFQSLTRDEVQGQWSETVEGHTVLINLASDGTATVTGIPVNALQLYDQESRVGLDWSDVTNLAGAWSYYEPRGREPAKVWTSLNNTSDDKPVSVHLELQGNRLVIYYGSIEFADQLVFTKTADQPTQTEQQLVSRDDFVGTWVGGTPEHEAEIEFNADGTLMFTNLPLDLLRSDGAAEIDWDRTIGFPATWRWAEAPISEDSDLAIHIFPKPADAEFDATWMDVALVDGAIILRMDSGQIAWDRHLEFQRSPE